MPENEKKDQQDTQGKPAPTSNTADKNRPQKLDVDALDLSIEEIEERVSPSETNVFDK